MGAITRFLSDLRIWPGPILEVELVTASRRIRHFILRVIYAVALLLALGVTYLFAIGDSGNDMSAVARFASGFFHTFGVMQLAAVMLLGPALAAGTIARERERGTMEYLYTTPLSNLEIILGKLGGRVMEILCFVLSGVPVLSLAMLMGGISAGELLSLTVITLSTVLFVTMVSLAVSAGAAKARNAVIQAYAIFLCLWGLPFVISSLSKWAGFPLIALLVKQLVVANPIITFVAPGFGTPPTDPWSDPLALVRNQMLAGGSALLLVTLFMRRIHLREPGKAVRIRRWRTLFFPDRIGDNPMYWKEICVASGSSRWGLLGYGLAAVVFVVVCGCTVYSVCESLMDPSLRNGESYGYYAVGMSTFLGCCGLFLVTAGAAGSIGAEEERDCWVSLVSTPLEAAQIIRAKIAGSIWPLRWLGPLLVVVWLPALFLRPLCCLSIPVSLAELGVMAAFGTALGVYCSLSFESSLRAMGVALGISLLLGGGATLCCCPIFLILAPFYVPFLLGGPGFACVALGSSPDVVNSPMLIVATAVYLVGTAGYGIGAYLLMSAAVRQFDKKSGRAERYPVLRRGWKGHPAA